MTGLRRLARDHFRLAMSVALLALGLKALLPAGYMISAEARVLSVHLCADASDADPLVTITLPARSGEDNASGHAKAESVCPYAVLALASLAGGEAPALPALLLGFILALGFVAQRPAPLRAVRRLRPPLRGPPLSACLRPH